MIEFRCGHVMIASAYLPSRSSSIHNFFSCVLISAIDKLCHGSECVIGSYTASYNTLRLHATSHIVIVPIIPEFDSAYLLR